ncbi:transcription factor bHLH68 isoform X2 [Dendrobium catenatum]|uniref:transcription factor bHLH68 isoform X2 n=1 Tax=Dendrobium catenatum TaxID=906689 RepID=UPI0009F56279|nr:transcription factor bHLH68 isoform X2 [Dendrobium catenatum]
MNRSGVYQGSLLQQMVGGSTSWWNMSNMRPTNGEISHILHPHPLSSSSALQQHLQPSNSLSLNSLYESQELPQSWSQLLLGGLVGEEERYSLDTPFKKALNWEEQLMHQTQGAYTVDVKQENSESLYSHGSTSEEIQAATGSKASWSQILPVSSPRSCVTSSLSCNMLDFSNNKTERRNLPPDHSSECNSIETGAALKKARIQGSSQSQSSTFKVRKEKLGDRITALHQLVSPFGKTDTASVLLEAIGYIRFLQSQIEALSSPYLNTVSAKTRLPLLNDNCMKKRGPSDQNGNDETKKDLRSRGLCLVPVSCTLHVGSDDGADYWSPSLGGCFR